MSCKHLLALAAISLAAFPASAQMWELQWADEFDYVGAPNPAKWTHETGGGGWGNQEAQYYTDRSENSRVDGNVLTIEARLESFGGSNYTSARLTTFEKASWRYGRFEARIKVPTARGTWSAFWMLPDASVYGVWPNSGEIDVVEYVGHDENRLHASLHMTTLNGYFGNNPTGSVTEGDATTAFHVYAAEWSPHRITFFVDDQEVFGRDLPFSDPGEGSHTWPFDHAFHALLNVAVGGTWGGVDGIDDAAFPQVMEVDYVRVYRNSAAEPTITLTEPTDGTTVSEGDTVTLRADASDSDGQVAAVTFFQAGVPIATVTEAPFEVVLPNARAGCYAVSAEVVDDAGWRVESPAVSITVGAGCTRSPISIAANPLPGIIEAEAFDQGPAAYYDTNAGNIGGALRPAEGVDIARYSGADSGYYLGWLSGREWTEYTVDVQVPGTYRIDARVASATSGGSFSIHVDGEDRTGGIDFGATGDWTNWETASYGGLALTSGIRVVRFDVGSPSSFNLDRLTFVETGATPTVQLDSPTTGTSFADGATISFAATASDTDDDVAEVAFLQDDGVLSVVSSPPYTFDRTNAHSGCYRVSARVTDARGLVSVSPSSEITVGSGCGQAPFLIAPHAIPGTVEAEHFDLGGEGIGYSDFDPSNSGLTRVLDGVDTAGSAEEGYYVTNTNRREWLAYTVQVQQEDTYVAEALYRASGGSFRIEVDGVDVTGSVATTATSGLWSTVRSPGIALDEGVHEIRIVVNTAGLDLDRLTWILETGTTTESELPGSHFYLEPLYPNPFTHSIHARFELERPGHVRLSVNDVYGRRVAVVRDEVMAGGIHDVTVRSADWAAGVYFVVLETPSGRRVRSVSRIR